LLDWKSSKSIWDNHLYQLAAYENLFNENFPKTVMRRGIIRIGKNSEGDFEARWLDKLDKHFEIFKAQLELYYAKKKLKQ